jgi:hypothetical protein
MGRGQKIIEAFVVILCLPFYAVMAPLIILIEWVSQKRTIGVGREVTHWPAKDLREDYIAVDVSRAAEGLVGIRRRRYGVLHREGPPPSYGESVVYIPIPRFWVPDTFLSYFRKKPGRAGDGRVRDDLGDGPPA